MSILWTHLPNCVFVSREFSFFRKTRAVLERQKLHSVPLNIAKDHSQCDELINGTTLCFSLQYHINKLSIMSSDNHMNNSEKEVDEVDAALSDLEITLEGGKTSNTLVLRHSNGHFIYTAQLKQHKLIRSKKWCHHVILMHVSSLKSGAHKPSVYMCNISQSDHFFCETNANTNNMSH